MGGSPKRFTESTDLSGEDYTESSTDDFGEDNLYDLVDVPIKKYDAGCSLPSTYSIRDFIEFRRENRRRSLVWISLVCMLMIVIMGLSIGLAKRSTDRDGAVSSSSSETTTTTTTRPTLFQIKKFLVEQGVVDSMYVLENDKQGQMPHPQHQAAVWLAKHDEAALPLPQESDPDYEHESYRYATRFVMALNYYALGGEDWNNGLKFLSAGDICSWYLVVNDVDAEGNAYQIPKGLWCDDNGIPTALTIRKFAFISGWLLFFYLLLSEA